MATYRPHDALIKSAFEDPKAAGGLLRHVLPNELVRAIDWSSLDHEPGSFIDENLDDTHCDLLFSANLNGRFTYLYTLMEHQSAPDAFIALRMLEYVLRIHHRFRAQHPGKLLPHVLPVVIANAPGGWNGPLAFEDLFDPPPDALPIGTHVPRFKLWLLDLSKVSNQEIQAWALGNCATLALWLLRDIRDAGAIDQNAVEMAWRFGRLAEEPNGARALQTLLRYVFLVSKDLKPEQLYDIIQKHAPAVAEDFMSIAEQLRQEGLERGRAEGRAEALQATLRKLLSLKFGPLGSDLDPRFDAATVEQLEAMIERVLVADSLDAVLREP